MENKEKVIKSMDGNEAAAHCAYAFTEVAAIYPITPSSNMGENVDAWAAAGKKNLFGVPVKVVEMQSEAGAAGTVHGSLQMGVLTTTFTASQGLLLKIPNLYKMAGQGLPGVIHVSARALAGHALSIFGDHQDVMAARQTGVAMLVSNSVQEVMDLAGVAHLSAIKTSLPFLHFFDGFRTSHEVNTVEVIDYDVFRRLLDYDKLNEFRQKGLTPNAPFTRGTAQSDDVYFQARVAHEKNYIGVEDAVKDYMKEISKVTGRKYEPFIYYGAKDAEHVIVAMGSIVETIKQVVDSLNKDGAKVGVIGVHLYRPFSKKYFLKKVPKTVKRIAVLDRTIESGAVDQPLALDVKAVFYDEAVKPEIVSGIYGLSSKDTPPQNINAVFANLAAAKPKDHFTIGIKDDLLKTSLKPKKIDIKQDVSECLLFGLGSDGTVGASKNIVKIIGDNTKLYSQAYSSYDSKKAGGVTRMHLRFSKKPISSTYLVSEPSFISCSTDTYLFKYDMLKGLKRGGTFLLNTNVKEQDLEDFLPEHVKAQLAKKKAKFYIVDAGHLAHEIGLGRRTNTIMQSAFFKLNENLMEFDEARKLMKDYALKSYGRKGEAIVNMNNQAIDAGGDEIHEVKVKPEWAKLNDKPVHKEIDASDFVKNIARHVNAIEGDNLPTSVFAKYPDSRMVNGSAAYEKRGIANFVPAWNPDTCIQCNNCVFACPHAVIRPFLATEEELKGLKKEFKSAPARGKDMDQYKYTIQVSPLDCTECGLCVDVCPTKEKSLTMVPVQEELDKGAQDVANYFFNNVTYKNLGDDTMKNVSFRKPLFEFSGACAGCGETPYIKTLTQLFGDRMVIANATGCTSIYSGSYPATPYTTDISGYGPAWANSLFEDNAEFGFGMRIAQNTMRARIKAIIENNQNNLQGELKTLLNDWILNKNNGEYTRKNYPNIVKELEKVKDQPFAKELLELKNYFIKTSQWIIGGDGWAYDIGYGGIDHVIANNEDVNILVVDTEVYSNTGGQSSKAAQTGSIAKFAASGKGTKKKDLASIAMSNGNVYVAQINHGANAAQVIKAFKEAESYDGPSIIIAYAPCIEHGISGGLTKTFSQAKLANACGYWPIFRYDPRLKEEGKNPFQFDGPRKPDWSIYKEHLLTENRYRQLAKVNPDMADELLNENLKDAQERYLNYIERKDSLFHTEEKKNEILNK